MPDIEWKYGGVAPLAGAWIEMGSKRQRLVDLNGRSPRGSVD